MFNLKKTSMVSLLLAAGVSVAIQAQAPRIGGLAQIWYTQMMDSNLRHLSSPISDPYPYYPTTYKFPGGNGTHYTENGFSLKRIELSASGAIGDQVEYRIMYDVAQSNMLQDAFIKYKMPANVELQVGQFKILGLDAAIIAPMNMLFVEHSQQGLLFGSRDRGASLSAGFGDPDAFNGRIHVATFNGSRRANDANAQKDVAGRLDLRYGRQHFLGAYAMQGSTDLKDAGSLTGLQFKGLGDPSDYEYQEFMAKVLDNKDKTSIYGAFYEFDNGAFYGSVEGVTGTWGRFFPSLGLAGGEEIYARREHLDQTFLGVNVVAGYTFGNHKVMARFDNMNYNSGDDWYVPRKQEDSPGTYSEWYAWHNPYIERTLIGYDNEHRELYMKYDFTPNYTEVTFGYAYAFNPAAFRAANIKVNYTLREKNFLKHPVTGAKHGGDSLAVAFQVAF